MSISILVMNAKTEPPINDQAAPLSVAFVETAVFLNVDLL
jgi:hypothetical protein